MAWEPGDGGSARGTIFAMLSSDSFAFLRLRVDTGNDVHQTENGENRGREWEITRVVCEAIVADEKVLLFF